MVILHFCYLTLPLGKYGVILLITWGNIIFHELNAPVTKINVTESSNEPIKVYQIIGCYLERGWGKVLLSIHVWRGTNRWIMGLIVMIKKQKRAFVSTNAEVKCGYRSMSKRYNIHINLAWCFSMGMIAGLFMATDIRYYWWFTT